MCVCVFVSLSVIRCNSNPPHLRRVGRKKERTNERTMYWVMYENLSESRQLQTYAIACEDCGLLVTACNVVDCTNAEGERAVSFVRVEVKWAGREVRNRKEWAGSVAVRDS